MCRIRVVRRRATAMAGWLSQQTVVAASSGSRSIRRRNINFDVFGPAMPRLHRVESAKVIMALRYALFEFKPKRLWTLLTDTSYV